MNRKTLKFLGAIVICSLFILAGYFTAPLFIEILKVDNPKYPEWYLPTAKILWIAAGGFCGVFFYFEIFRKKETADSGGKQ